MQTKFKRHQEVKIKSKPNQEYVEYHEGVADFAILPGMKGKVNLLMPNGQYHVEIIDEKNNVLAYALFAEEDLESV